MAHQKKVYFLYSVIANREYFFNNLKKYSWLRISITGIFKDLQLEKLQYFPWTAFPIEIEKEEVRLNENTSDHEPRGHIKKVRTKVTFPDQEVPNLIKIIHGSPQNSDKLAKKFLHYWQSEKIQDGRRFSLTKRCVLKKIKELATWQASQDKKMCWMVPIETQKEFGTEIIKANELDKKPQKCYIWKFIKKDNKTTGMPSQVPSSPEVVLLD